MVEYDAIIESAIFRRRPMTLMSSVPSLHYVRGHPLASMSWHDLRRHAMWRPDQHELIRPAGPEPATWYKSTLAERARCRTAGTR